MGRFGGGPGRPKGECCRTERRPVKRGQAFWATPRTLAFNLCEVGAMGGFWQGRDLVGLEGLQLGGWRQEWKQRLTGRPL